MKTLHGRERRKIWTCVPVLGLCLVGLAAGQATRPQPAVPRTPAPPTQGAPRENLDLYLAIGVALENDYAISLAKLAQTRAESKDVVKFAEMIEKDHEQFAGDVERFAGNIPARRNHRGSRQGDDTSSRPDAPRSNGAGAVPRGESTRPQGQAAAQPRREAAPPQSQAGTPPATPASQQPGHPGNAFLQIKQELADEYLQSAQRELHDKKGSEFDKCYMGMQLAAHMRMIDTLKVFEKHSTPELQQVFQKGLEASQEHFDNAKKIMKGLDGVRTARRDNGAQ